MEMSEIWPILWISVNILAFAMMLIDKGLSLSRSGTRIRELYLLLPILLGSLPGTFIGMICCRHKISQRKRYFQFFVGLFAVVYYIIIGDKMVEEYKFSPSTLRDLFSIFWSQ